MKSKRRKLRKDKRNGQYYVRIQVEGVRKYFPLGTNRRKAKVELGRLERLHGEGELDVGLEVALPLIPEPVQVIPAGDEISLKEVIAIHLEWMWSSDRAKATCEQREYYLEKFLRYAGDRPVSTINKLLLSRFHGWAKKNHSKGPNGGNVFLRNVKSMFLWADDMEVCRCPVRRFPFVRETPPETKRFTDTEIKTLLSRMKPMAPDFYDMLVFSLLTGLRPQELRQLKREHIIRPAPDEEYLEFQKHKTAKTMGEPKKRTVPLIADALAIVDRQIAKHPWRLHVFLNKGGRPYTANGLRRRLKRWCQRAGIPVRPPYAWRHTFGSMQAEANVNQTVIAQMMGHSQLRTTARYIANNAEHHRKSMDAIKDRINELADLDSPEPEEPDENTTD